MYRSHAQAKLVDSLRLPVPLDCQQAFFRARAMNARFEPAASVGGLDPARLYSANLISGVVAGDE